MLKEQKLEMVVSGTEKSKEEIVWNNLMTYMEGKGMSSEEQAMYLKNTVLYLQYEKKKNELLGLFIGLPALISVLGATDYYVNGNTDLATSLTTTAAVLIATGVGFKLVKTNPYQNSFASLSDIKDKENIYRKVAKYLK